jgi:hypothetical protein
MNQLRTLIWLSLIAGLSILALGFIWQIHWSLLFIPLILGWLWWLGARSNHKWLIAVVMVVYSIAMAAVFLGGFSALWLAFSSVAMLVAWDLQFFAWRLMAADRVDNEVQLITRHYRRLVSVTIAGIVLVLAATFLRFRLGFEVILVLGLLAVLGLRQGIYLASKAEKNNLT